MNTPMIKRMRQAIDSLDGRDRLMLLLTRLEGLSPTEISDVLAIPDHEAIDRLRHAEAELGRKLEGDSPAEEEKTTWGT